MRAHMTSERSQRLRSHWGWGWADKFPSVGERASLAERIAFLLGVPDLARRAPREPVALEAATVREPRVALPDALAPFATQDRETRARRALGRAYPDLVRGFSGDFSMAPDLVCEPRSEADVQTALEVCARERLACIPYGGGTSVTAGVEPSAWLFDGESPYRGVVTLDLGRMSRLLEVDEVSRAARFEAGVLGPALEEQLAPHGLTLRHYPQSFEFSTLGGWIATRSGGHFATLTTHIDDFVEAVRVVTPTGTMATKRFPASGAGPSPERLVLGSEGVLGVITEAWVRVLPRPHWRATASVRFERFEAGARAARAIAQSGLYPANCRLLDPLECLLHGVPSDGGAMLLLGFESADHPLEHSMERALDLAEREGGRCHAGAKYRVDAGPQSEASSAWKRAFFEAPYLQTALVSLDVVVDTFETACTWEALPRVDAAVRDATKRALDEACGGGVIAARFTHVYPDGPAPYYTFVGPGRPGATIEQWLHVKRAASDALAAAGATITHHHSVGRVHRPWYEREVPEPFLRLLGAMKASVDPLGILNPDVLLSAGPASAKR